MTSFTSVVPFGNTLTTITGATLPNIPKGLWAISMGWKYGAVGNVGDGNSNNATYGLSTTPTGFDLISLNRKYALFVNDPTSYESYADNIVLTLTNSPSTTLYLNAFNDEDVLLAVTNVVYSRTQHKRR